MSEHQFTPEQQAEYDKETQRLEAEAGATAGKTTEVIAAETPSKEVAKSEDKPALELPPEVQKKLETLEKRVSDTQRAFHTSTQEVARLKREAEERKRTETRPAILDANPGLEDAIQHVAGAKTKTVAEEEWLHDVSHAIPDVNNLLADPAFSAKALERRNSLGEEWLNPLTAIRELSDLKTEHLSNRNTSLAVESARKDFEAKAKKKIAMEMPGGSGGRDTQQKVDEVQAVWAMSDADFAKQRAKVMGF